MILMSNCWLENVDVDMAELEINRKDIHDEKKLRGSPTFFSEKDYKPIIIRRIQSTLNLQNFTNLFLSIYLL